MRACKNTIHFLLISLVLYGVASTVFLLLKEEGAGLPPAFSIPLQPLLDEFQKYSGDHSDNNRIPQKDKDYVFIGIKTSAAGVHGERLPQIEKTWLKDALNTHMIDIKFFTEGQVNKTSKDSSLFVQTPCGRQLPCKTGKVFAYYLEHTNATWICSFDDDNYVLVDNLIKVLKSYENETTKEIYLGRAVTKNGITFRHNITVQFGTGGAGYCLSRPLVERGKDLFTNLRKAAPGLPDDVAVGYVAGNKLGVNLTISSLLHSHYEGQLRKRLPQEEIAKQISFGRDNKRNHALPVNHMPNIPLLFSQQEDPLSFRALWCFLHESERHSPECTPSNSTL